jgi:hypothetical protein
MPYACAISAIEWWPSFTARNINVRRA